MAISPIDYTGMLVQPDFSPLQAIAQQVQQQRLLTEQKRAQEAAAAQKVADIRAVTNDPTRQNLLAYQLKYPKDTEAASAGWKSYSEERQRQNLSDMSSVYAAIQNGRPDYARSILKSRQDALKGSGEDTSQTDQALALLESGNPEDLRLLQGIALTGIGVATGPDKFESTISGLRGQERESALLPSKLRKGEADADVAEAEATISEAKADEAPAQQSAATRKAEADADVAETTARYAPKQQEADLVRKSADVENIRSLIEERAARLDLDRDKLTSDVQLQLEKMDYDRTKLSDGQAAKVTEFVTNAEANRGIAQRARAVAERFQSLEGNATASGWFSVLNGQEVAQLRRDYAAIMGSQAIKNLPPGSASDTDIKLAIGGFPPQNARPSTIRKFLTGLAKLQDAAANSEQSKADWIANNGNLGTAQRDLYVNGTRVPKGTTYGTFAKSRAAYERRNEQSDLSDRSYMRYAQ